MTISAWAWYFHVAGGTGAIFNLPQRPPNAYTSLSFCTWYIIAYTVLGYEMNTSYIKAIKSAYNAHRGSKTVHKKGMNKYLEAEKEVGAYGVTERVTGITEEHAARKSCQSVVKRANPSSSASGLSRKRAQRELEAEVPLQGASQPEVGSVESEEEQEVAPLFIQSWRSKGPATSEGTTVVEGSHPEALLASLTTSGKGAKAQPSPPSIMMPVLKVVKLA